MPEGGIFGGVFTRGGPVADDAAWLRAMLAAESALARALERAGLAPPGAGAAVTAAAARPGTSTSPSSSRSSALTGNPVPGLARALTRLVADPAAKSAVHKGATSQDIMDTAAMLLARDAIDAAADSLSGAAAAAARLADAHRASLMIGRTLLQQAVPVTFGVVAAGWLAGLDGALDGLASVRETRLAVQFGGAAGTLASLGPSGAAVKSLMAAELGLADPPLPWHTERLRIIDVAVAMARVTAALSKIARDVTLLAQTEIAEVSEGAPASGGRGLGAAPGRLLGHAQQEQPGRRGRHPRLRAAGRRPARHPRRQRRAGAPARGRRLARRVAAVQPPARAGRVRRRLGPRPAGEPDRRHRQDGRQPRRRRRAADGRAGHRPAARLPRRPAGARPGRDRRRAGGGARACRSATCCWRRPTSPTG